MMWKKYQNELIVLAAFLLMVTGYGYKSAQVSAQADMMTEAKRSAGEIKEVVALQKIWSDTKTGKKVEQLHTVAPQTKVKWSNKSKKVTATYTDLTARELNQLITKILNTAVEIQRLDIVKKASSYDVEFKCKW